MDHKLCFICKEIKSFSEFYKSKRNKTGYHSYCKKCAKLKLGTWNKKNPEALSKIRKKSYLNNIEYHLTNSRNRYLELRKVDPHYSANCKRKNPEKVNNYREQMKIYRKLNKHLHLIRENNRRASKLNATPIWANKEAIAQFYIKARKLTEQTGIKHQVDHIVPLRSKLVCGFHWEGNLQVLTSTENFIKGNRTWPNMPP